MINEVFCIPNKLLMHADANPDQRQNHDHELDVHDDDDQTK